MRRHSRMRMVETRIGEMTHIDDPVVQQLSTAQCPEQSLDVPIAREKVMCADVWVLGQVVISYRGDSEMLRSVKFVKYE